MRFLKQTFILFCVNLIILTKNKFITHKINVRSKKIQKDCYLLAKTIIVIKKQFIFLKSICYKRHLTKTVRLAPLYMIAFLGFHCKQLGIYLISKGTFFRLSTSFWSIGMQFKSSIQRQRTLYYTSKRFIIPKCRRCNESLVKLFLVKTKILRFSISNQTSFLFNSP